MIKTDEFIMPKLEKLISQSLITIKDCSTLQEVMSGNYYTST